MIAKTILMLSMYLVPAILFSVGAISSPWLAILLYLIGGLGIAGIGMGIMHDANHGAYTKNSTINYLLSHSLDLMGCSSELWKLQHNVLHHTYTNIHTHDEDINPPIALLRFSPHGKRYWIQRYQHYYVWFFYSILTLYWITVKDFRKAADYYSKGLIRTKKELWIRILKLIPLKLAYFTYALVLPMIFAPFSPYWILLGFVLMHLLAGFLLSVVFQLAHVVPDTDYPLTEDGNQMNASWFIHQLQTTSNFSPKNKFLFWYLGGLTNQVEHHLFPNICHVHYQAIGRIVKETAEEYNVPYHENNSIFSAIAGHVKMLRDLGRAEYSPQL